MSLPFGDKLENIKKKAEETYEYLRENSPAVKIYNVWTGQRAKAKQEIKDAYDNMASVYSPDEYEKALKCNEIAYKYAEKRYYKKAVYYAIKAQKYARLAKNRSVEYKRQFKDSYKPKLDIIEKNLLCMEKNIPEKDIAERKNYNDYVLLFSKHINLFRTDQFDQLEDNIDDLMNKILESKYKCPEEEEKK
jgi:hypothetical protein